MPFYLKLYVYRTLIPLKLGHSEMPSQSPENTDNAYHIETIGYLSVDYFVKFFKGGISFKM